MKAITHLGEIVEVDDDVMGIVNEIRRLWPDLRVQYLDPDRFADLTDSPYIIVDQMGRKVLGVWQLDKRVLEQLSLRDKSQKELQKLFDKEEAKAKKEREDKEQELRDEKKDVLKHVFSSPKGTYSFKNEQGEKVIISDSQ